MGQDPDRAGARRRPAAADALRAKLRGEISVEVARDWAEVAAMLGDYAEAVSWLDYVESVEGDLDGDTIERRRAWRGLIAAAPTS
jgi:hypothetical protein